MRIKIPGKILLLLLLLANCIEPYPLPESDGQNLLVVDGMLNGTDGSCKVKLTRAMNLASTDAPKLEPNAQVSLVEDGGTSFPLVEVEEGIYEVTGLTTSTSKTYILKITTADQKEYQSDPVQIIPTPPIDSVTWAITDDGLRFGVNTHDPENKSRYYQWSFVETWEYTSVYASTWQYEPVTNTGVIRELDVSHCWETKPSTIILVGTTTELNEAKITNFPLTTIPKTSYKIGIRYSMLVKQSALTEDAYNFWNALRKNTENLGSLFDPMPSRLLSNVRNIDDGAEPVLGYFSATTVSETRFFIRSNELPSGYIATERLQCQEYYAELENGALKDFAPISGSYELTSGVYMGGIILIGFNYTRPECMDCRQQGGTLNVPDFW